jgi:flagellar biosynthesis regulator FlbT
MPRETWSSRTKSSSTIQRVQTAAQFLNKDRNTGVRTLDYSGTTLLLNQVSRETVLKTSIFIASSTLLTSNPHPATYHQWKRISSLARKSLVTKQLLLARAQKELESRSRRG